MTDNYQQSKELFNEAQKYLVGGVNSPVRSFKSVEGIPFFVERADGPYLYDVDQNRFIDYVGSWGPMLLGHNHPHIRANIEAALKNGISYGTPCATEITLAREIQKSMPHLQRLRFVSSGTEAAMTAIRLARGYTGKNLIIKFEGCYHGHVDALLIKAGSGNLSLGKPDSLGIPDAVASQTIVLPYNDIAALEACFSEYTDNIAAVIVEPIAGNMNLVVPERTFMLRLRELTQQHSTVLIFDEVMTGFRVSHSGATGYFNIIPDLTILGKIIGAGMPVGAIGGKQEIMCTLAPEGGVYQAGTLSGQPLAMVAGATQLSLLDQNTYLRLEKTTATLLAEMRGIAREFSIPFYAHHVGSMFGIYFQETSYIKNLTDVMKSSKPLFLQYFHGMLREGVYVAPSMFEAGFVSLAHTAEVIDATLSAFRRVCAKIQVEDINHARA